MVPKCTCQALCPSHVWWPCHRHLPPNLQALSPAVTSNVHTQPRDAVPLRGTSSLRASVVFRLRGFLRLAESLGSSDDGMVTAVQSPLTQLLVSSSCHVLGGGAGPSGVSAEDMVLGGVPS